MDDEEWGLCLFRYWWSEFRGDLFRLGSDVGRGATLILERGFHVREQGFVLSVVDFSTNDLILSIHADLDLAAGQEADVLDFLWGSSFP
jgi:hypothetical protein